MRSREQSRIRRAAGEDATVKTARAIARKAFHNDLNEDEKKYAGPAVHYGLGTLLGLIYGVLAETVRFSKAGFGAAYGAMV